MIPASSADTTKPEEASKVENVKLDGVKGPHVVSERKPFCKTKEEWDAFVEDVKAYKEREAIREAGATEKAARKAERKAKKDAILKAMAEGGKGGAAEGGKSDKNKQKLRSAGIPEEIFDSDYDSDYDPRYFAYDYDDGFNDFGSP